MPRDKTATHQKVIEAAREEFLEYGFQDASMRRIAERVGMTAAGLYRHFPSKAAMFEALVEPAAKDMKSWLKEHMETGMSRVESDSESLWESTWVDLMRDLVYPRMEEYRLLLTCAAGTKYENFFHDLVEDSQAQMAVAIHRLKELGYPVLDVSDAELHMLLSAYNTALFEPVMHGYTLEEAEKSLPTVEAFFLPGWKKLMGF